MAKPFSIKIDMKKSREAFKAMHQRARNPEIFMDVIAVKAWKQVLKNIKDQQGEDKKWPPFKAGGRWKGKGKRRVFDTSAKLLVDTGLLRNSISFTSTKYQAIVFTNNDYAIYHQSNKPRKKLPRRDFMWLPKGKIQQLKTALLRYLKNGDL